MTPSPLVSSSPIRIAMLGMVEGNGHPYSWSAIFNGYDPEKMAEVRSIADLSSVATQALLGNGAFFSRPYGKNTRLIVNRDSASMAILKKLKNIFYPNQIMNPGKICW